VPREIDAVAGVTEIKVRTAAFTLSVEDPEIAPELAVMVVVPWATLVASPPLVIVATEVADEAHFTVLLRFCVLPSL
jgi:hypothetical protein